MKTTAFACAALIAVSLTGTAQATTNAHTVYQQVVHFGDLNLANEADAAILRGRIESAARNVCGMTYGLIPMEIKRSLQACVATATARAVADVNALNPQGKLEVRNTVAAN